MVVVAVAVAVAVVVAVAVALPLVAVAVARVEDSLRRLLPRGLSSRRGTQPEDSEMRKS